MSAFLIFTIFLALVFDFLNGFHDASNSIATVVSTRVLKPQWAVLWAAFFNLIAFAFFDLHVAHTVGQEIVDLSVMNPKLICASLLGAVFWNLWTWYLGLPSSSSHALIGGMIGAALMQGRWTDLNEICVLKVLVSIVLAPLLGCLLGGLFILVLVRLFFWVMPHKVNFGFKVLQLISSALISLGHGGNDAQKTMGLIGALLWTGGVTPTFTVPTWAVVSCNALIAFGTLFGGWRIVRTMGMRITKLSPPHGFCAESAAACTLFLATSLGIPVSTTHTLTGSIIGVGLLEGISAIRWGVAGRIVWAWVVTLPCAGLVAALCRFLLEF